MDMGYIFELFISCRMMEVHTMQKRDNTGEQLVYSLAEAADILGFSKPTMVKIIHMDGFPALRVGKRWLIPAQSLNAWLVNAASAQKVFE